MSIRDRPLLTDIHASIQSFIPNEGSAYIFAANGEQRNAHSLEWESNIKDVKFLRVVSQDITSFEVEVGGETHSIELRSQENLKQFWSYMDRRAAYLDVTGLDHSVWAPLVKFAIESGSSCKCIYVEPLDYMPAYAPTPDGEIFDLSEKIHGIQPLPGFVSLAQVRDEDILFIPLLGFQGPRVSYMINKVDPFLGNVVPIIGVPGFRAEYPFHTYFGNQRPLAEEEIKLWKNAYYATANCPFSLFYTLQDICMKYSHYMPRIAPIGTKPHALGAVLFALSRIHASLPVDILYDHPVRKDTRTGGASRLLVYDVSTFAN